MSSFSKDTSIHGFKFIFDSSRDKYLRICWTLIFLSSLTGFAFYVYQISIKWKKSPEIISIEKGRALDDFLAPALTFCPNVFARNYLANYSEIMHEKNYSESTCKILFANIQRTKNVLGNKIFSSCLGYPNIDTVKELNKSSFEAHEIFGKCLINLNHKEKFQIDCKNILSRILTDIGFCFSFNLQSFETIFNTDKIHEDFLYNQINNESIILPVVKGDSIYPYKANKDFKIKFEMILDEVNAANRIHHPFYFIYIHRPNEIPTESHKILNALENKLIIYNINLKSNRTSEELRRFEPNLRKCYFDDERQLYYFKHYTKALCDWECHSNWTFRKCGCVKFSMPRNKSMRVCGQNDVKCFMFYYPEYLEESLIPCNCYPLCNDIEYKPVNPNYYGLVFESTVLYGKK